MDVITLHQAGFDYSVASSGTSLTVEQVRLIKRFTQNITFLYDGDDAGLKAALRGLDIALTEGLNVRVCVIPNGDDPDSYLRKYGAATMQLLLSDDASNKSKQSFLHFQTDQLLKAAGNDPVKRADVVNKVVSSLALVNDPVRRSLLMKGLSERMNVAEEILVRQINQHKRQALRKEVGMSAQDAERLQQDIVPDEFAKQDVGTSDLQVRLERSIARLFIEHGQKAYGETMVAQYLHSELADIEWAHAASEIVYREFVKGLEAGELPTHHQLLATENKDVIDLVSDIVNEKYQLSQNWEKMHEIYTVSPEFVYVKDVDNVMNRFKLFWIEKLIVENNRELKEAEQQNDQVKVVECLNTRILLDKKKKEIAGYMGTAVLAMRNNVR
jgi:DNA primase